MSTIRIPPTLRAETGGQRQVEVSGGTVRELLDNLTAAYPALKGQILENGDIAPFVNVYLEGEDVRTLQGLDTAVSDSATVILLPAMAGGSLPRPRALAPVSSMLDLVGNTPLVEL